MKEKKLIWWKLKTNNGRYLKHPEGQCIQNTRIIPKFEKFQTDTTSSASFLRGSAFENRKFSKLRSVVNCPIPASSALALDQEKANRIQLSHSRFSNWLDLFDPRGKPMFWGSIGILYFLICPCYCWLELVSSSSLDFFEYLLIELFYSPQNSKRWMVYWNKVLHIQLQLFFWCRTKGINNNDDDRMIEW